MATMAARPTTTGISSASWVRPRPTTNWLRRLALLQARVGRRTVVCEPGLQAVRSSPGQARLPAPVRRIGLHQVGARLQGMSTLAGLE